MAKKSEKEIVKKLVDNNTIFSISMLIKALGCSHRTAQRKLASLNVYTSYNSNGKYYTLPGIPKFDDNGLWEFNGVRFSKYGTLKNTVIRIVNDSAFGFQYGQLCELLGIPPNSLRTYFKKIPELKHDKRGRYSYVFSKDKVLYQKQIEYRGVYLSRGKKVLRLELDEVAILVDRIKYPDSTIKECAQRMSSQGRDIDEDMVYRLLSYHDLLKKTADLL